MTDTQSRNRAWLERMLEIRFFEERVQELFMEGRVEGTTHLCQGQEAVSVGAVAAMRDDDYLTITYRGHGQALARGLSMESCFAELMGRSTGCCKGVGGSMHFTDLDRGLLGAFAIVGAGLPVALGAAYSAKLQGDDRVALTFFGDGATNIGTFHEAVNTAAAWEVGVVFIVENNLYGEYTPMRETTPIDDLADRAKAYDIPGVIVDGQDIGEVFRATSDAIARARRGDGPSILEMKTYRYRGHSRTDPARYRPPGELDEWQQRDPIRILGDRMAKEGVLSHDAQAELRSVIQQRVDNAAVRAQEGAPVGLEELKSFVYSA
jgi:acetoin:2,6-dichlorophenolindophenol oxidoreductase subunit alpha